MIQKYVGTTEFGFLNTYQVIMHMQKWYKIENIGQYSKCLKYYKGCPLCEGQQIKDELKVKYL